MTRGPTIEQRLLRSRLAAQGLSPAPSLDPLQATRRLLAVQAQDHRGARLALRVRSTAASRGSIDAALSHDRSLVITWANRGTLHLIAAEDEPLLHALTTPQLRPASDRQLHAAGIGPARARRALEAILAALGESGPMTRAQLREVLRASGVPAEGPNLYLLLIRATIDGHLVRGPLVGGEHAFVLASDWLGERPRLDRERALAELARRYLAGHGPAGERDLARWAQLPLRDVRRAFAAIAREVEEFPGGLLDLRRGARSAPPAPRVRLLGPFDPLLLGWSSREFVLAGREGVVTSNGIFRPVILIDGQVAGTWSLRDGRVELGPSERPSHLRAALTREAAAVESYLQPVPGRAPSSR